MARLLGLTSSPALRVGCSLWPYKTSYPTNRYYLYYSGSEASGGFRDIARPAQRGHRAGGSGTPGKVLFDALAAAIRGLYAAGRTAAGICSNSYVSGLSPADCVFSGRRAGRHVASAITSGRSRAHG